MYNHANRTSLGYVHCQSILHTIVLTEMDACALNCGDNVSNVRVAEMEMRKPSVRRGFPVYMCKYSIACGHVWRRFFSNLLDK